VDEALRSDERSAAAGDPEARGRLERERCRSGQCCAHSWDHRAFPPLPREAAEARVRVDLETGGPDEIVFGVEEVATLVGDPRRVRPGFHGAIRLAVRGGRSHVRAALGWLNELFPSASGGPALGEVVGQPNARLTAEEAWGQFSGDLDPSVDRAPPTWHDVKHAFLGGWHNALNDGRPVHRSRLLPSCGTATRRCPTPGCPHDLEPDRPEQVVCADCEDSGCGLADPEHAP